MFLSQSATSIVVDIKLTNKGREILAGGKLFEISKFSFGDSEIDYQIPLDSSFSSLSQTYIMRGSVGDNDLRYKLYSSGFIPTGQSQMIVSSDVLNIPLNNTKEISVYTIWPPVVDSYVEEYKWTNLGPLDSKNFRIGMLNATKTLSIRALNIPGSTTIKVEGMISGAYRLIIVNFGSD